MPLHFHGILLGHLCPDCPQFIYPAVVRLYRADAKASRDKEAFEILSEEAVNAKAGRLIGETETDAEGRFSFEADDDPQDQTAIYELDVRLEQAPGQESRPPGGAPVQATLAQARAEGGAVQFHVSLAARLWCQYLARFDAWTICGRVLNVTDGSPVGGLTVEAYDADWLQDDTLGSATTDSAGHFRIFYTSADFKRTPWTPLLNVELTGGPDLYFKVRDGATLLIDESQSAGRQPGRENVGHCFCTTLRVQVGGGDTPPVDDPLFTHIGDFNIVADIDATTGLTSQPAFASTPFAHGGPGYGFFSVLKLIGYAPAAIAASPGSPVYYRFVFEDAAAPGVEVPVAGDLVAPTPVGNRWIQWDQDNDSFAEWRPQSVQIRGSGPSPSPTPPNPGSPPPLHVIVPDANGWILVDPAASGGGFDLLMRFNSGAPSGVPGGSPPHSGPGQPVPPADQRNGKRLTLTYQVATSPGGPVVHHSSAVIYVNNWPEVRLLELFKPASGGGGTTDPCAPATDSIEARHTVDHELLHAWSLGIRANNGWTASGPSGNAPRGGSGTHPFPLGPPVGGPAHCSHTVTLSSQRRLTNGEQEDDSNPTSDTFCT